MIHGSITFLFNLGLSCDFLENVPEELWEPLYKDQYEQEHLKPSVCKLLLSPNTYCQVQSRLLQSCEDFSSKATRLPGDNSALLQFLIKTGCCPKVQDKDVSEEDLSVVPIKTVCVLLIGLPLTFTFQILTRALTFTSNLTLRLTLCHTPSNPYT